MRKFSESTGHRDTQGNWVNETPQAKLRNQLGPFWTLVDILSEERLNFENNRCINCGAKAGHKCELQTVL